MLLLTDVNSWLAALFRGAVRSAICGITYLIAGPNLPLLRYRRSGIKSMPHPLGVIPVFSTLNHVRVMFYSQYERSTRILANAQRKADGKAG
jgi:hypothetical protein